MQLEKKNILWDSGFHLAGNIIREIIRPICGFVEFGCTNIRAINREGTFLSYESKIDYKKYHKRARKSSIISLDDVKIGNKFYRRFDKKES